jgi:hypothetical protein
MSHLLACSILPHFLKHQGNAGPDIANLCRHLPPYFKQLLKLIG